MSAPQETIPEDEAPKPAYNRRGASRIGTIPITSIVFFALIHRETFGPTIKLAGTVLRNFFWLQFQTKMFPWIRPVVSVDHPLDETIPFRPAYVNKYLSFFHLWMRVIYYAYQVKGKAALPEIAESIATVAFLYSDAGSVYRTVQSTTNRPRLHGNAHFKLIYSFDPHLHCIPSLHVLVVLYAFLFSRRILPHADADVDWVYGEAVEITESILFIKQHSVNCVGSSLFIFGELFPEFDAEKIETFIADLFSGEGSLTSQEEIRGYLFRLYRDLSDQKQKLQEEQSYPVDYSLIVTEFLLSYPLKSETKKPKGVSE